MYKWVEVEVPSFNTLKFLKSFVFIKCHQDLLLPTSPVPKGMQPQKFGRVIQGYNTSKARIISMMYFLYLIYFADKEALEVY